MEHTYWQKQMLKNPLFADLLWSKPESKQTAGKLLIIGGNSHGISAPAEAYSEAAKAGVGTARVLLPDSTKATVGALLENVEFAPSTPSGSFSQHALAELTDHANWADGVLVAGDLGRNSETAILLEKFLDKFTGRVTLTKDAAGYVIASPKSALERPNTLLVLTIADMQKLFIKLSQNTAITYDMGLVKLVEALHDFTVSTKLSVVVKHAGQLIVAVNGQVSTTPTESNNEEARRIKVAAHTAVWWLQNPSKPFEAITTSLLQ
jgi:NAD(P)H-hydrate repair Nnr-like enzyme with NAD(P)H-hydrate dehydratase domain